MSLELWRHPWHPVYITAEFGTADTVMSAERDIVIYWLMAPLKWDWSYIFGKYKRLIVVLNMLCCLSLQNVK